MPEALVVVTPFGQWSRGDVITDAATIAEVRRGENAGHVVPVRVPDQPAQKES